jgi:hypothetical protein
VLQVESRVLEATPEAFEKVERSIAERLSAARVAEVRKVFIEPAIAEMGLRVTDAGKSEVSLLDEGALPAETVLAEVAGRAVRESDFRWFLNDALIPSQRAAAYGRPGARQAMLTSFLDMLVLTAKARKQGLDQRPAFLRERFAMAERLRLEFLQAHDKAGPFCACQETPEAQQASQRRYFANLRAELRLRVLDDGATVAQLH